MNFEKHELISAKFTPKNELVYLEVARIHIGKTFRWMHFKTETTNTVKGLKNVTYFTPHDAGYEHIPAVPLYELSNIIRIELQ